jgi:hypothetical protein
MFTGYGDGLICCWEILSNGEVNKDIFLKALVGHTNKINHLTHEAGFLFSAS